MRLLRRVTGAGDDLELGAGNLLRHVLRPCKEGLVLLADHDQRWHADLRERLDHAPVALREDAARRVRQADRARALLLELARARLDHAVPAGAGVVLAVAGTGVDQRERADPLRVCEVEGEREVAAERVTHQHRAAGVGTVEQRRHVGERELDRVVRGIIGCGAPAVAAQVPADDRVSLGQRARELPPVARAAGEAVREEQRGAAPGDLGVDQRRFLGTSRNARSASVWGSLGRPSTRSETMLRWISSVPPAIETAGTESRISAMMPSSGPSAPASSESVPLISVWTRAQARATSLE